MEKGVQYEHCWIFLTYVHVSFKLHLHLGLCENSLGAVLVFGLFFCVSQ